MPRNIEDEPVVIQELVNHACRMISFITTVCTDAQSGDISRYKDEYRETAIGCIAEWNEFWNKVYGSNDSVSPVIGPPTINDEMIQRTEPSEDEEVVYEDNSPDEDEDEDDDYEVEDEVDNSATATPPSSVEIQNGHWESFTTVDDRGHTSYGMRFIPEP